MHHQKLISNTFHVATLCQSAYSISQCTSLRLSLSLLSAGVKNADENELKAIASPPEKTHVYNVADFGVMSDIVEGLTKTICDRVEQLDKQLKGLNSSSFQLRAMTG